MTDFLCKCLSSSCIIYAWLDQQISLTLQRRVVDAFEDFSKGVLKSCSYEPSAASIPVTVRPRMP